MKSRNKDSQALFDGIETNTPQRNPEPKPDIKVRLKEGWQRVWEFSKILIRNFQRDGIGIKASGMVYSTLIALIPCVAFLFTFLGMFGVLQPVQEFITNLFVDLFGIEAGQELVTLMQTYTTNATSLGVAGLISFCITAVILINKVWAVVNQIYRTSMNRNTIQRFAGFLTSFIIGVLLIGGIVSLQSRFSSLYTTMMGLPAIGGLTKFLQSLLQWVMIWFCLFLFTCIIPNAKVRAQSAALGSLVGTLALRLSHVVYTFIASRAVNYSVIYGSVAAVFLFFLWLYIIWVIFFIAVEIAYIHQYRPELHKIKGLSISPARQISEGINIMMLIGQNFKTGKGATTVKELSQRLLVTDKHLYGYLDLFEQAGFILPTNNGKTSFISAQPLEHIKIIELVQLIYGHQNLMDEEMDTPGEAVAAQIEDTGMRSLGNLTVDNLLERV